MHKEHRERVRKRFETLGLEDFDEHQVLEMMLFYAIPRKDTNEIAHRLIDRFGSFAQVMDTSLEELERVEGMGHSSALMLKFFRSCYRYYQMSKASSGKDMKSVEACAAYLMAKLEGKRNEEVYLLCLDAKRSLISCLKLAEGDICSANISPRKVLNAALSQNAMAVVLAHNHPGGFAIPSQEDVQVTLQLGKLLHGAGIYMLDHIVVTDNDYVSMFQSGLFNPEALGV